MLGAARAAETGLAGPDDAAAARALAGTLSGLDAGAFNAAVDLSLEAGAFGATVDLPLLCGTFDSNMDLFCAFGLDTLFWAFSSAISLAASSKGSSSSELFTDISTTNLIELNGSDANLYHEHATCTMPEVLWKNLKPQCRPLGRVCHPQDTDMPQSEALRLESCSQAYQSPVHMEALSRTVVNLTTLDSLSIMLLPIAVGAMYSISS